MTTIAFNEGRVSSMAKESRQRSAVLQGTLDMMILKTLLYGPAHGHRIGKHIQRATNEFLQMQHGSLYPALHRLEKKRVGGLQMGDFAGLKQGVQVLPIDG
jgi:hypothetical protein